MNGNADGLARGGPAPNVHSRGRGGVEDRHSDIFFAAIETTRMPMILADPSQPDTPIVFANQSFVNMTGYSREEIVGRNCRFLQGPDTDRAAVAEIALALRERREIATEILNYRRDGASFWNALFISPVYNHDGALAYFFASQLDVSRRRDAEEALRQAQKMEAVGQLTGGIAHDFNNLLQIITGYMDGLKEFAARSGDARAIRQAGAVAEAADRATTLTQQLLAFSRKQRLEGRVLSVNDLVDGMGDLLEHTLGDAIRIDKTLDPALRNARLDPSQAEVALLNVVINARDAMAEGGTIAIETANVDVRAGEPLAMEGLSPGDYVRVGVSDTGAGIPEALLKRVLEPFFTTKEEGKGTGLGLSMVYGFVRQSGGTLTITSEVGRGTTVSMYFPAATGVGGFPGAGRPRAIDKGGSERILVVDDRPEVAELARSMLEDLGYAVEVANDGRAALALLESRAFDMLFSDLIMPGGLNGVGLAREAQRLRPRLKVLLTTGYADSTIERTDAGGLALDTIDKPYRRADLARKVRAILDGPTGVS